MPKKTYLLFALLMVSCVVMAQPKRAGSAEIHQKLRKLNVLGSVLYVAAHPDDENTSVIGYYANQELFRTGYLAATRGDGGQNLVGPEIREQLGIIRTQELLAARRIDGGEQFFSRANDFGYSKNPEETFKMWNRQEILADFVWVYRKFRPDVIITRFDDQPPNHGHHTASAILAREAFKLAGDKNAFPEQLKYLDPWQPKRVYWNLGWWTIRRRGIEIDEASYGQIPIGKFNPVIGMSYTEMSALSRSMHKSQAFGSTGSRGERDDYVTQWEGDESLQPFENINTGWERVKGGKKVQPVIEAILKSFDPMHPDRSALDLLKARRLIEENLKDDFWRKVKTKEIDDLLLAVTGSYLEVRANDYAFTPGDSVELTLEAVNRSAASFELNGVQIEKLGGMFEVGQTLAENQKIVQTLKLKVPENMEYSQPYWLKDKSVLGRYEVADQLLRGLPENPSVFTANYELQFGNTKISVSSPVVFKRNDQVDGEVYRPIVIQPAVMTNIESSALIFSSDEVKEINVRVIAGKEGVQGDLRLNLPSGWTSLPDKHVFRLEQKNEEQVFVFDIKPPVNASVGKVKAVADVNGEVYNYGKKVIEYDHIPTQTLFPISETQVVKLDIKKYSDNIGYIMGSGDDIPQTLEQIGYKVTLLRKDDVSPENLKKFDAVILGIRAFNTLEWLTYKNQELFKYVEEGGNLIVQYTTTGGLLTKEIAPYALNLSRERVAVEEAEVRMLVPDHPAMNSPNKITEKDFEGWVQERGLYFSDEWSEELIPILSANDPNEPPRNGGLLIAKHGKGYYVYTGYSWFRELPAGVPGAYRIFTNLIELGNDGINN